MITGHGGNINELAREIGCAPGDITDMSSNLNPIGPPDYVKKALLDLIDQIRILPEPDAGGMKTGFADFYNIDPEKVIAGNGTTWFIYTIPMVFDARRALIAGPSYSDYRDACMMNGTGIEYSLAEASNRFRTDMEDLSQKAGHADLVFICNPVNPTGTLLFSEEIEYLSKQHRRTLFIVDESYLPFTDNFDDISMTGRTDLDNLIVLSSMSKIFTLPGLRTGFLTAGHKIVEKIMKYYQPWSVNSLAQAVVTRIFDSPEKIQPFYNKTRDFIKRERDFFFNELENTGGIELFESCTSFILAQLAGKMVSKTFCRKIGMERILIRDCANFEGLSDRHVRFSLKTRDENQRLADLIKKAV